MGIFDFFFKKEQGELNPDDKGCVLNGVIPAIPDPRDFDFNAIRTKDIVKPTVDLRPKMSPIDNQYTTSSCVGHATAGALEYLENNTGKRYYDHSRLFIYYNARLLRGLQTVDRGCIISDAIKSINTYGTCHENYWRFDMSNVNTQPKKNAYFFALKGQIKNYYKVNTYEDIFAALSNGHPIIFGAALFRTFKPDTTGYIKMPDFLKDERWGGHAMLLVGYTGTHFIVRNSWGTNWGVKGYCYMPYEYFNPIGKLVFDLWVIRTL